MMTSLSPVFDARTQCAKAAFHETDYTKWERKTSKPGKTKLLNKRPVTGRTPLSNKPSGRISTGKHSCSSLCQHGKWNTEVSKKINCTPKARKDNALILKMQIASLQESIQRYKQHYVYLVKENIKIKEEIESKEKQTNLKVSDLLESYHKFRGTMALMKKKHAEALHEAEKDANETEKSMDEELKKLSFECEGIARKVDGKKAEIKKLCTYKEKEYPEKVLKIGKLRRDIKMLDQTYEAETAEMASVMEVEEYKYQQEIRAKEEEVQKESAEMAVGNLTSSEMDLAVQNALMKKELATQLNEKSVLEYEIEELKTKIKDLTEARDKRRQKRLSPWQEEVCRPEMELTLDFPRVEQLHI